jgi:hypothetical protein
MSRPLRVAAHDLPFRVGIGVVPSATLGTGLAGAIVAVFADRLVRSQFFWPVIIVLVQAALVVVDEHVGWNVHRRTRGQNRFSHIPLSPLFQPMPL